MKYKYPKNWFKHNLIAVPAGTRGNCSACVFRNALVYCKNMACTYVDFSVEPEIIRSVYWVSRDTNAHVSLWTELRDFFDKTPTQRIRDISNDVMRRAVRENMKNAR